MKQTYLVAFVACVIIGSSVIYATKDSSFQTTPEVSAGSEALPITGTPWVWLHTEFPDGDFVATPKREEYVLTLEPSGSLRSTTDCNTISGAYRLAEDDFSIENLISTEKACGETLEAIYAEDLKKARSLEVAGDRLYVHLDENAGRMVFEKK